MELLVFKSFGDFTRYLEGRIEDIRRQLNDYIRRYNEIKERADRLKNIEELFAKMLGAKPELVSEIDLKGLKIVIGARPTDEVKVLEEVIKSLQDRLNVLIRVLKLIEPLASSLSETPGIEVMVEFVNGIPVKILLRETYS